MTSDAHRFLFYTPHLAAGATHVELDGEEGHHARRVVRVREGDAAAATNGDGLLATGHIESVDDRVVVRLDEMRHHERPPQLTLALACLKKDACEMAVRQATELGVSRLVFFDAAACHVREYSDGFLARLHRITTSAMKQSFQAYLPAIEVNVSFESLCERVGHGAFAAYGDPAGVPSKGLATSFPAWAIVGPEAGLSTEERAALADCAAIAVSVSPNRLRAETASTALLAALAASR